MCIRTCGIAACVIAGFMQIGNGGESEKWADPQLPARRGLVVWLDASRQAAAWQAHGKPALVHGAAIDVWYDGSGGGLNFVQAVKDSQPRCLVARDRTVVRFDGQNDFLSAEPLGRQVESFTAFIVAAPRSNTGFFRGLLAGHETGKNDYTTGFTIDMSGPASDQFDQINVEGKGFGGAADLLDRSFAFAEFHTIEVSCAAGDAGVRLTIDGNAVGTRKRQAGTMKLDGLLVAARVYSNSPEPPAAGGFLDGDIAEVLLYDRVLSAAERSAVREYLARKHAGLTEAIAAGDRRGGRRLKPIDDAPLVQMLVPGFTARELPVELNNVNNVRYRHDGKLVALGYDGNIHLLSDTDGDGLEDRAELFWDNQGRLRGPIGIALVPRGYKHATALPAGGFGVFVASKGKLSLIVDADSDDRADREVIVATGWKEIPQNVDAIGVALAPDGSVYFALGTANYANGYLLDEQGRSHYDGTSERGTVLRVAPDFSHREIVCTGTRFPVALAFNRHGDLFASEQEGATWLPNGNPFDELLHIQPGRHYGFPPRHPRYLPGVIDEPSVFDYGPQHQSTCGLVFNEPCDVGKVPNLPTSGRQVGSLPHKARTAFGPAWWAGDALVCGESRGKIFRTKLTKTGAGYVAMNQTIACHVGYTLALKDGRVLSGVLVESAGETVVLGDPTGKEIAIAKSAIEELKPSPLSAMPADIGKKLDAAAVRDLITFLMTDPLEPTKFTRRDVPPPRRRADIEPLLKDTPPSTGANRPLHVALVAGPKDHGPDEHDYPMWQSRWSRLLRLADHVTVSESSGWPTGDQFAKADVIMFNSANPSWNADKAADLDRFLARGGGLVYIHFATNGGSAPDALADRIGLVASMRTTRYRHGPLDLVFADSKHPTTREFDRAHGLERVHFVDESYWNMTGDSARSKKTSRGRFSGRVSTVAAASSSRSSATTPGPTTTRSFASSCSAASAGPPANRPTGSSNWRRSAPASKTEYRLGRLKLGRCTDRPRAFAHECGSTSFGRVSPVYLPGDCSSHGTPHW